jgi:SAM-dependent methyltransferase
MNQKIYNFLYKNLSDAFILPKYNNFNKTMTQFTVVNALPWTPKRWEKFCNHINNVFDLDINFNGTLADITNDIDKKYSARFFGEIWKPKTESFSYTGWAIVDEVNNLNPSKILDVGCGYNQFKARIPNLIGIDPFNNNSDYMVDILEYNVDEKYDVIIAFGSINFNSFTDIDTRINKVVSLLADGGRIYIRANPGIQHEKGPWVDVFPWSFEYVMYFAKKYNLELLTFKKDNNDRLYFVYQKHQ